MEDCSIDRIFLENTFTVTLKVIQNRVFMGIFNVAFRSAETTNGQGQRLGGGLFDSFFGFGNGSAPVATAKSALTLSPFFCAVNMISDDIAMLPKNVIKKDGSNREQYTEHPANFLISEVPNDMMTAFNLWKIVVISMILKGDAYVEIIRNGSTGSIDKLVFRAYDDVNVFENDGKLYYRFKGRVITSEDMLHFLGFTLDGKKGIGVVKFAAMSLGVSLESQAYSGEIYQNKGLTYGVVESDQKVNVDAKKKLAEGLSAALSGKNVHRAAFLDEGMKYKPITITPAESQFLETNKAAIGEVGRWLRIPLHKLGDLSNANFSNIYQQGTEYVQYTMLPWVKRGEQECDRKLYAPSERGILKTKFNEKFLLRGDLEMKQKFYTAMVYAGIMNRNEVRALEDYNPAEGLDEFLQPVNMNTLEQVMQTLKENSNDGNKNQ